MFRVTTAALTIAASAALMTSPVDAGGLGGVVPLDATQVASGLNRPIFATYAPGDFKRLFIVEQRGVIKILNIKTGVVNATPFLDIDSLVPNISGNDERGLLGLAFHPEYQTNNQYFVYYINSSNDTVIARYERLANPDVSLPNGIQVLFIDQPQSNHNGGWMGFSPNDGYLYIGTGDGGGANDQHGSIGNAQDITNNLLGKMLRIDVDATDMGQYGIPASNPYAGVSGDDEIWAHGLRNPWRNCFDRDTGDLYIADVGQNAIEEINFQSGSSFGRENYGWRCMEGNNCTGLSGCTCNSVGLKDPIQTYSHSTGFSITGGPVYRGCRIPSLDGHYFYADFVINNIWTFRYDGTVNDFANRTSEFSPANQVGSFGEDAYGEVYICDRGSATSGAIYRVVAVSPGMANPYADVNCSGTVDVDDIVAVVLAFGPDADGAAADTDGDCDVDIDDIVTVVLAFGQSH